MATVSTVTLIDDIDGSDADETVFFSLDGSQYAIDLSDMNAAELRRILQEFVSAGRRLDSDKSTPRSHGRGPHTTAGERRTRTPASRDESAAVRVWAREAGLAVSDRGRISSAILQRYQDFRAGGPQPQAAEGAADVADDPGQRPADDPRPGDAPS